MIRFSTTEQIRIYVSCVDGRKTIKKQIKEKNGSSCEKCDG